MTIQEFIQNRLRQRVEKTLALVVYDPERRYREIVLRLAGDDCRVVDGTASTILGREEAMEAWVKLVDNPEKKHHLVIYLSVRKPGTDLARQQDPYQIFALGGGEFPRDDGDEFQALCHQTAPDLAGKIDELFQAGVPDFDTINNLLAKGATWPKLRTLLKVESASEILAAFLSPTPEQKQALEQDASWVNEFHKFAATALGQAIKTKTQNRAKINSEVWRYVLLSEFTFDLPGELPPALHDVPHATAPFKDLIYSVCETLRTSEKHQTAYMDNAGKVADDLQLAERTAGIDRFGDRDTFAFQERGFLKAFVLAALSRDTDTAAKVLQARKYSLWVRHTSERQVLWTTAERALELILAVREVGENLKDHAKSLQNIISYYCEKLRQVDRLHRDLERAVTDNYGELEELEDLVSEARKQYFHLVERAQVEFVELVRKEGWPLEGEVRSTQVFEKFVAPWLQERKKIAYFLVDALRYELGVELEKELAGEFKTEIRAACAQLPTITRVGMAALMPEAEGNLKIVKEGENLVPYLKDQKVVVPQDRLKYLQGFLGDRCYMIELDQLLTKKPPKWPDTVNFLLVRTTDIDNHAETKPLDTFRLFPDLMRKIIAGVKKLRKSEFDRAVIATDHGFLLFSERLPGETVEKPAGDWFVIKDRCLLGSGSVNAGTVAFKAGDVGLRGDYEQVVVPRSFAAFVKGRLYCHGGLSLQECILPVISVDLSVPEEVSRQVELRLTYKGGATSTITTRRPMIEVSLYQAGLFDKELEFQLEAYAKGKVIGEVGSSDYVNPATNLVKVPFGKAIKIPLKMDDDFSGSFEVKASDPVTGLVYSTLKLKTDYMD